MARETAVERLTKNKERRCSPSFSWRL